MKQPTIGSALSPSLGSRRKLFLQRCSSYAFDLPNLKGKEMAVGQNQWYHFGVGAPPILEPILVVGLGCSNQTGYDFDIDPWPNEHSEARSDMLKFQGPGRMRRCLHQPLCPRLGKLLARASQLHRPARLTKHHGNLSLTFGCGSK